MRRALFCSVVLLAMVGCPAHLKETVCPEYRDIRCVNGVECAPDAARGCEVCRCRELPMPFGGEPVPDSPHNTGGEDDDDGNLP